MASKHWICGWIILDSSLLNFVRYGLWSSIISGMVAVPHWLLKKHNWPQKKGIHDKNFPSGKWLEGYWEKGSPSCTTDSKRKEEHAGKGKCCSEYSIMVETGSGTSLSGAIWCDQYSVSWWQPCWPNHKSLNGKCWWYFLSLKFFVGCSRRKENCEWRQAASAECKDESLLACTQELGFLVSWETNKQTNMESDHKNGSIKNVHRHHITMLAASEYEHYPKISSVGGLFVGHPPKCQNTWIIWSTVCQKSPSKGLQV